MTKLLTKIETLKENLSDGERCRLGIYDLEADVKELIQALKDCETNPNALAFRTLPFARKRLGAINQVITETLG